uniref:Uncharacterized protein LOC105637964 n=1 Tax=Rhizophora mucronata TaxID=61149 RepID=A0A2P2JAK6_RHIMU
MSIPLERSDGGGKLIQSSGFVPDVRILAGERRLPASEGGDFEDSDCSSSIGQNSDVSGGESSEEDCREEEVKSSYKGPLDTMDALEEVLPVKKGISKFYNGKSKSFTSLADASSASSVKEFAKPENPYTKKRKNLFAHGSFWLQNPGFPVRDSGTGMLKRPGSPNGSTMDVGLTRNCFKDDKNSQGSYSTSSSSSSSCLPPLHPHGKKSLGNPSCLPPPQQTCPWRSFSLSDLRCAADATSGN